MTVQKSIQHDIEVRKPLLDFSNVPQYYMNGSVVITHLENALSMLFPEGERFFIRSVRKFQDQIKDPKLREEVKAFVGQEVQHGKAHDNFNNMLKKFGYNIDGFVGFFEGFVKGYEPIAEKIFGAKTLLAITAAAEHYTASLAHTGFTHPELFEGVDPEMMKLFMWHAGEEIEHKHVAFDVLETVDDSYLLRIWGMVLATFLLYGFTGVGMVYFMLQEKNLDIEKLAEDLKRLGTREGGFTQTSIKAFFSYFKPGFHPKDVDDLPLVKQYFAENPAAAGA